MGPIHDSLGLEQGGCNSDRLYKLCNNNQLSTAQLSQLGIDCGPAVISSIGLADDSVILSDCIYKPFRFGPVSIRLLFKVSCHLGPRKN